MAAITLYNATTKVTTKTPKPKSASMSSPCNYQNLTGLSDLSGFSILTFRLLGHGFFILGWTFEQQLIRIEDTVFTDAPGHDGLGFIA
jgi:hypothetical protein